MMPVVALFNNPRFCSVTLGRDTLGKSQLAQVAKSPASGSYALVAQDSVSLSEINATKFGRFS